MKRVALHTLGCKLNFAETSTIGRQFVQRGYTPVGIDESANVVLINTCSVTERAERECRQLVRRAQRHSPGAFVIVAGCYAQLRPQEISAIPGVDLVLGTREKFDLFEHVADFSKKGEPVVHVSSITKAQEFRFSSSAGFSDRTRAFLKIQDGCDYNCAFCTIPIARGESRSVPVIELIPQALDAVREGYKEIVLTGVNVGDYGRKTDSNLVALLRKLVGIDGVERIRVSSIEPNLLNDDLLDFWLAEPRMCKHFHIPLQSGMDPILKKMRRRYLTSWYQNRVERIKTSHPHAGIGADVIVGFPGESEDMFQETYDFLQQLPVSYLHVFTYSERPQTPAAGFEGFVEPRVRAERSERLRALSARKRRLFYESFQGMNINVLFEENRNPGCLTGLSDEYVRVSVASTEDLRNQIVSVRVTGVHGDECVGEVQRITAQRNFDIALKNVVAA